MGKKREGKKAAQFDLTVKQGKHHKPVTFRVAVPDDDRKKNHARELANIHIKKWGWEEGEILDVKEIKDEAE